MIKLPMNATSELPVRSSRRSASPKAATARSISLASRTLTGLTSTRADGATDWIAANWPIPDVAGIPNDRDALDARRDLFQQFQPFSAEAVFELD